MTDGDPTLELTAIQKRFGSVVAIAGASIIVRPGTIHGLLGENGAGKTTMMRIAYGMVRPDAGAIRVRGAERSFTAPAEALEAGIGMVHQHFTLVPSMSVQENLALGGHGLLRESDMRAVVEGVASRTGFVLEAGVRVESLPVSAQQRVEIAKALVREPSVLILDEPTALLAPREIEDLLAWLRRFVADGHAVVLITHKLREALAVADDITVMRHGHVVFSGSTISTSAHELSAVMLGHSPAVSTARVRSLSPNGVAKPMFEARNLTLSDDQGNPRVHDVSFIIREGDCVGIAAVEGSGQHELLRALAGRLPVPAQHLRRPESVGYIPADRHRDAVLLDRSLAENVALRGAGARHGVIKWRNWHLRTDDLIREFDVRAPGSHAAMRSLSGGNQQKLVLAREMMMSGEDDAQSSTLAIIADNATRGLDVHASRAIHERLRAATRAGAVVVFHSSDLDEILELATRVMVLHGGVMQEVALDRGAIGRAMVGAEV